MSKEMTITGLIEKELCEYCGYLLPNHEEMCIYKPENISITETAGKIMELCNTERRLIKEAAKFLDDYRFICSCSDVNFTQSKVIQWLKEFKELEKYF